VEMIFSVTSKRFMKDLLMGVDENLGGTIQWALARDTKKSTMWLRMS
jgi:hypothetical protein